MAKKYQGRYGEFDTVEELQREWMENHKPVVADYYQTIEPMPDNYDWRTPMQNATNLMVDKFDKSWSRGIHSGSCAETRMNLWAEEMMSAVMPKGVWEFFDYPGFNDTINRYHFGGVNEKGELCMDSMGWTPFGNVFPATVYGVVDLYWFPSKFNTIKMESQKPFYSVPTTLRRWFIVVAPRTRLLASQFDRKILISRAYTRLDLAKEQLRNELKLYRDNYRPRS